MKKQTKTIAGLDATITIHRDAWGIGHARARSRHDAFFAQGWLQAEDRFWQMDAARRRVAGRGAEWVGREGIAADTLARRLGASAACQRDYAVLGPEARAMTDAYAAGVNAWLAAAGPRPAPEYAFLPDPPEAWEPWHCIAALRWRGWLMGSLWFKLWRAAAVGVLPPEQIAKLRIDDEDGDRLCIPPGADSQRWIASLAELAPAITALREMARPDLTGGGSNNWALAGSRTASGRPLVAGDPHRVFEMPGLYAQGHIACDEFDAIGPGIPGVPGFPHFGHNGHVAWGVTYAFSDIHDLFVERFEERDGALHCLFEDRWLPVASRRETIRVRDRADHEIEVHETGHGPIIAGDPTHGTGLALRSMQFIPTDHAFESLALMLTARTVDALFEATRGWGLMDHNLVAADTAGNIGHRVRAIVPVRPRINGWLPVPGWSGEYEWQGVVPFEEMPQVSNPPRGYIVTANNRIVADDSKHYLCTDCHPPYRARRLEELIAAQPAATPADMARLHGDVRSPNAGLFRELARRTSGLSAGAQTLRERILEWNGEVSADSLGASAYEAMRWTLAEHVARRSGLAGLASHELLHLPPGVGVVWQVWWMLPTLVRNNDTSFLAGENWPQAAAAALEEASSRFKELPWAQHHRALFVHPLQGLSAEAHDKLAGPSLPLAGDNETVLANGTVSAQHLGTSYGPVARYVFDVGNWEESRWIVLDGASGNADSPHRYDQNALWARCELIPMLYDWSTIERDARESLTLAP